MENKEIRLIPADLSLAQQVVDFYTRNRVFLAPWEPERSEDFFTVSYQGTVLQREMLDREEKRGYRFYIQKNDDPDRIIGSIGLSNVVWGAFYSAFLGYKLDGREINQGYMSAAVEQITKFAFETLHLHRIEANVIPRNAPSLRVLEKNQFVYEGLSRHYLNINGTWEDHVHMVKINEKW